jgi:aldehyde dehydrogenase (NAD+)
MKPLISQDAAKKIVWGKTAWGGQWCTSPGYAYVHESVAETFVAQAKAALIALYGSNPKSNPDYSRIISPREVERLISVRAACIKETIGCSLPQSLT